MSRSLLHSAHKSNKQGVMSVDGLVTFLDFLVKDVTPSGYVLVLSVHYILTHDNHYLFDSSHPRFTINNGSLYSLNLDQEFLSLLEGKPGASVSTGTDSTTEETEKAYNPSLGVLTYVPSPLWQTDVSPSKLTFAWCALGKSTVLCHILKKLPSSEKLEQIGSLSFDVQDYVEVAQKPQLRNPREALKRLTQTINDMLKPKGMHSASGRSTGSAPATAYPPGPNAAPSTTRQDGGLNGMLIGPNSPIFAPPHRNPPFGYDPIDPLLGSGDPWPDADDVRGNLPAHLGPRIRPSFQGPYAGPFPPRGPFGAPPF